MVACRMWIAGASRTESCLSRSILAARICRNRIAPDGQAHGT